MIDWNRVTELREEIGAEDFGEVVEIFLEEVEAEISQLKDLVPQDALEAKLHFLKGSALNLGFTDFASMCQTGEICAAQKAFDQIDLPDILATYDRSKSVFLSSL